jgi:hypothetical protein
MQKGVSRAPLDDGQVDVVCLKQRCNPQGLAQQAQRPKRYCLRCRAGGEDRTGKANVGTATMFGMSL